MVGKNWGSSDGKPHEGFYTQEQIKDIVKYAQDRFITIIPEIDLPGHMVAALASYPRTWLYWWPLRGFYRMGST